MEVRLHPLADDEYWNEVWYYERISSELADKFKIAVDKTIKQIEKNPFLCHNRGDGIYSVRVKGFPFTLFYEVLSDEIIVTSVFMQIRDPEIWKSRKGIV